MVTNSCNASGDIPGGCERGSGNDRAHVGVGFGSLSIQFEGKKVDTHRVNPKVIHLNFLVKFIKFVELPYPIGIYALFQTHLHYAFALCISEKSLSLW